MAIVGQQLLQPEAGWKRYDEQDPNILYEGIWSAAGDANDYGGTFKYGNDINGKVKFNFTGSKIRLISRMTTTSPQTKELVVKIDGIIVGDFSIYTPIVSLVSNRQQLVFEIDGLSDSEHYIEIYKKSATHYYADAVDIDENGELKPYNETPPQIKHLIKSSNKIYSLVENTWTDTLLEEPLTQLNFEEHGILNLKSISKEKWQELSTSIEILTWTNLPGMVHLELTIPTFTPLDKLDEQFEIITWTDEKIESVAQIQGIEDVTWTDNGKVFEIVIAEDINIKNIISLAVE